METYLGLDLGGTKLLIGEIDSRGNMTPVTLISRLRWKSSSRRSMIISVPWAGMTRNR